MRCTACGEGMTLTAVVQDDILPADWFARHALACPTCAATERRLVFTRGLSEIARASEAQATSGLPTPLRPEPEPPPSAQATGIAPAAAWMRAVEKLRSRQADLDRRADALKKASWNVRFNEAWEKLAPVRREPPPPEPAPLKRRSDLSATAGRVLRARLRKMSPPLGRSRPEEVKIEPSAEAVQKFNQFWESLLSAGGPQPHAEPDVPAALLPPLPKSVSLVPIETLDARGAD
jgi:hypothetical protein